MSVPTLCGYILVQEESQSVQGVNSYDILFAGMSNVWKRYLFANPVTFIKFKSSFLDYAGLRVNLVLWKSKRVTK